MIWFTTSAGRCWGCDKYAADVHIMYVNDSNYRYCFDCRYDPKVYKRSADDDDAAEAEDFWWEQRLADAKGAPNTRRSSAHERHPGTF